MDNRETQGEKSVFPIILNDHEDYKEILLGGSSPGLFTQPSPVPLGLRRPPLPRAPREREERDGKGSVSRIILNSDKSAKLIREL